MKSENTARPLQTDCHPANSGSRNYSLEAKNNMFKFLHPGKIISSEICLFW